MNVVESSPRLEDDVRAPLPLVSISRFKNIHKGERVAILANGPSLNDCDLSRLDRKVGGCKVIGVNRAWEKYECDYLCIVEAIHLEYLARARQELNWLFCGGANEEHWRDISFRWGARYKSLEGMQGFIRWYSNARVVVGSYEGNLLSRRELYGITACRLHGLCEDCFHRTGSEVERRSGLVL